MERDVQAFGAREQADQVDRIALEDVGRHDIDAAVLDFEIRGIAQPAPQPPVERAEQPVEARSGLQLLHFEPGADRRHQMADVAGDKEIMLHEAFDAALSGARHGTAVARPPRVARRTSGGLRRVR